MKKPVKDIFTAGCMVLIAGLAIVSMASCEPDETSPEEEESLGGTWVCSESSENGQQTYQVTIEQDQNNSSQYYIYNFHNLGLGGPLGGGGEAYFTLSGNSISMPQQTVLEESSASGSGTLGSDREAIELSYDFDDGSGILLEVQATYTKQ